jgi:hypothetical protein
VKETFVNKPQFPEAFSSTVSDLGAPRRYFPVRKFNRAGCLVSFFSFISGSILVFLYGLYVARAAYQRHGFIMIEEKLMLPVIIAFAMLVLGLAAGRSAYVNWKKGVAVYDRGFAVRDRKGIRIWRWEEIVSLTADVTRHHTAGIYIGTKHVYHLYNRQNQHLVLGDLYTKMEELAEVIQDAIFPILYDQAAQKYNSGQWLIFGPVAISKAGIQIGNRNYPWTEVQQVSIQRGILKVSKKGGGWFSGASASASVIPNLNVLLALIYQVVGLKVG